MTQEEQQNYFRALDGVEAAHGRAAFAALDAALEDEAFDVEDYTPQQLAAQTFRALTSTLPPVAVTYDVQRRQWRLMQDYTVTAGDSELTIRTGFEFDLSSIPRAFWSIIAPNELSLVAPLVHDFLYMYRGEPPADSAVPYRTYTRLETDRLFLHCMKLEGVSLWRRSVAYRAVRTFGGVYWAT